MRLDVISYRLPMLGEKRGGIERVAHDLAEGLARRGHRVTVWSYDLRPADAAYQVCRLPLERMAQNRLGLRLLYGYAGNIASCLPHYEGDAIIANGDSLLLPLRRKPLLRIMHGSALGEALAARTPWRFASQFVIYGQELLTALTQRCVGNSHNARRWNPCVRQVIPLGVDLEKFRPAFQRKTIHPSILFVGTLSGRKRGGRLLEWFAKHVRPQFPDARLTMLSESGPAIDGVEYRAGVSQAELIQLYQQAWVYASPSSYEGFGLPYLEAMACGTAVVATPNPGSRELLQPDFSVLAGDIEFPDALCRLLRDRDLRSELQDRGVRRAQQFSLAAMLDSYETLLFSITGKGKDENKDTKKMRAEAAR
jgi:phosphatidylinositol alpha-mannosyltransferase